MTQYRNRGSITASGFLGTIADWNPESANGGYGKVQLDDIDPELVAPITKSGTLNGRVLTFTQLDQIRFPLIPFFREDVIAVASDLAVGRRVSCDIFLDTSRPRVRQDSPSEIDPALAVAKAFNFILLDENDETD